MDDSRDRGLPRDHGDVLRPDRVDRIEDRRVANPLLVDAVGDEHRPDVDNRPSAGFTIEYVSLDELDLGRQRSPRTEGVTNKRSDGPAAGEEKPGDGVAHLAVAPVISTFAIVGLLESGLLCTRPTSRSGAA